jgi:AsmA-like C-terminal region
VAGDAHCTSRTAPIITRLVNVCWSLFQWCLLLAVAAGLIVGGYLYFWLDDEIRRQVEKRLADHYTNLEVRVGRARFEQEHGIAIYDVRFFERPGGEGGAPILSIDKLYLAGNLQLETLVAGDLPIDQIIVRRAKLRAIRQPNRQWNVRALLPLPSLSEKTPVIKLEDTTLIVEDAAQQKSAAQTLQGINLTITPLKPSHTAASIAPARFRVAGGATGLPAREMSVEGEIGTTGADYDLSMSIRGLEVSSEMLAALPGVTLTEQYGADISGRADIKLRLSRDAAARPPAWSADVEFVRGRIAHASLPEPLTELSFRGTADAKRFHVARLTCNCGPASIVLAGERTGWSQNAPLALAAKVSGLPLNDRLRSSLPGSCANFWQRFQPAGIVDAELRLTFDGAHWRPQLSANCRGMSLTDIEKFPYRLQQTTGQVEYEPAGTNGPGKLRLNLSGLAAGQPVRIDAELAPLAGCAAGNVDAALQQKSSTAPHALGFLELSGSQIPLDEQLLAALPPKAEQLVRSLRPQGAVDFRFRAEWNDPAQPRAEVTQDITLKDCVIFYDQFPYPLRHVAGRVTQRNGTWTIHDVEGRGWNDATIVVCRGESIPQNDGFNTNLSFRATNVALDDNLKLALPPAAQQAWDELRPQGRVDFTAHAVCEAGSSEPRVDVVLEPRERSVSLEPAAFPYRLEQIEGAATYSAGRVEFRNVIARHDHAVYSAAAGSWQPTPGGWQIQLHGFNADRLTPHRDLLVALPAHWRRTVERLHPSGTFGIYNSRVSFAKAHGSDQIAATWDVNLNCQQATFGGELPLQSVTGGVHLVGRHDGRSPHTAGELTLDSVVAKDVQLTNVRGPLWIDVTQCLLGEAAGQKQAQPLRRITADAYGGSVAANVEIQHQSTPSYTLDVRLGGASVARFANERLGGPGDMSGTASGQLRVSGTGSSPQTIRGEGALSVVEANIYELPVLVAMLKVLRNRTPNTTAFNRCDMQFAIDGGQIHFEKLNLLGDAVSLYGKGESNFDRRLDLVFYTLLEPANLPIPLWKTIAGQVSQQTLQLKVVGTWDNAEVQPQTLPGFNQVLEQIQNSAATMAPSTATRDPAALPR